MWGGVAGVHAQELSPRRNRRGGRDGGPGGGIEPARRPDDAVPSLDEFLQKHYKEMTPGELAAAMDRVRTEVEGRFGVVPTLRDYPPIEGVRFAFALNLSRCIGCRKCVHACVEENNLSRSPEVQYIRVLEMPRDTMDLERGDHHYNRAEVPDGGHYYLPVQ